MNSDYWNIVVYQTNVVNGCKHMKVARYTVRFGISRRNIKSK